MRPSIASTPRAKDCSSSEDDVRRRLDVLVGDRQDVGDRIDQQADDLVADLRDDDDVARGRFGRLQAEAGRKIDDRQHRAAQVDHAAARRRANAAAAVAGVQPRISRTDMMSTQNS